MEILFSSRHTLEMIMRCVNENWPLLLVGPQLSGKTSQIRLLAELTHKKLHEFAMTPEIESSEL